MKRRLSLATMLMTMIATLVARADEIRSCEFEVKARCVSGEASVTLANGVVTKLAVNVDWCGRPGNLNYSCTIDSARSEHDATWSEEGGATIVTNNTPWTAAMPDRVKVTVGKDVSIDFSEAQSLGRCGTGAELPRTLVIPAQGKTCRVSLTKP